MSSHILNDIVVTNNADLLAWDEFVLGHEDSTFFHRSGWGTVVKQAYGHEPHYLAALQNGRVIGVLPLGLSTSLLAGRRLISAPLADYAGICCSSQESAELLITATSSLATDLRVRFVEFRHLGWSLPDLPTDTSRATLILELDESSEKLWKRLKGKVRNQVRKAQKSGLDFRVGGLADVAVFYDVYAENTRDLGSPMHGRRFFDILFDVFPDQVAVFSVWEQADIAGAAIGCVHRDTLEIPWAASLRRYFRSCPNNLLYWGAMEYAIERGCRRLNFGRSRVGSGPYKFKEQWGAEPLQLYYQYVVLRGKAPVGEKRESRAYRLFSRVWPKVPMPVAKRLGPMIFRQLPI